MRYRDAIKLMDEAVKQYKGEIDDLARDYRRKTDAANRELDKVAADLTPAGQAKFRESRMPKSAEYTERIRASQERARAIIDHGMERLTAQLDLFFATPPSSTFLEHITAIAVTGMVPTNREFGLLRKDARTYAELRLLQNLGDRRTRTEQRVELTDPGTATTTTREVQVENPFKISLPDPDAAYAALKSFENAALGAIRYYSGENLELAAMLPDLVNDDEAVLKSGLATGYFLNKGAERLTEAMDKNLVHLMVFLSGGREKRRLQSMTSA